MNIHDSCARQQGCSLPNSQELTPLCNYIKCLLFNVHHYFMYGQKKSSGTAHI